MGVTIENWTNQKLEFPEDFISEGARDMWYKPSEVIHGFRFEENLFGAFSSDYNRDLI